MRWLLFHLCAVLTLKIDAKVIPKPYNVFPFQWSTVHDKMTLNSSSNEPLRHCVPLDEEYYTIRLANERFRVYVSRAPGGNVILETRYATDFKLLYSPSRLATLLGVLPVKLTQISDHLGVSIEKYYPILTRDETLGQKLVLWCTPASDRVYIQLFSSNLWLSSIESELRFINTTRPFTPFQFNELDRDRIEYFPADFVRF